MRLEPLQIIHHFRRRFAGLKQPQRCQRKKTFGHADQAGIHHINGDNVGHFGRYLADDGRTGAQLATDGGHNRLTVALFVQILKRIAQIFCRRRLGRGHGIGIQRHPLIKTIRLQIKAVGIRLVARMHGQPQNLNRAVAVEDVVEQSGRGG